MNESLEKWVERRTVLFYTSLIILYEKETVDQSTKYQVRFLWKGSKLKVFELGSDVGG